MNHSGVPLYFLNISLKLSLDQPIRRVVTADFEHNNFKLQVYRGKIVHSTKQSGSL